MSNREVYQRGVQGRLSFFSLLYGMPATISESRLLEAWPASIYGHLREGYISVPSQAGRNVPICLSRKTIPYVIQRAGNWNGWYTTYNLQDE